MARMRARRVNEVENICGPNVGIGTSQREATDFESSRTDDVCVCDDKFISRNMIDEGSPPRSTATTKISFDSGRLDPSSSSTVNCISEDATLGSEKKNTIISSQKTAGDIDARLSSSDHCIYNRTSRLSVAHRNDKNDSDSNLSFKTFRRSLSILKQSLVDSGDYNFLLESDEDDEFKDDDSKVTAQQKDSTIQTVQSQPTDEDNSYSPSLYAKGTSLRSMRSLSQKSIIPSSSTSSSDRNSRRKVLHWLKSFYHSDPRWQICNFFDDLAYEGVRGMDENGRIQYKGMNLPLIMRVFSRVGVFSVWRPTSKQAIRKMINGEGTGKGMDIKGKSAKRGKHSGYVPFLQIHHNEDKLKVGSLRADTRVRVFYPNKLSRDKAFLSITLIGKQMVYSSQRSMRVIGKIEENEHSILADEVHKSSQTPSQTSLKSSIETARRRMSTELDYSKFEAALESKHRNSMVDATVYNIDDYASSCGCYGLDIPEKLFWEAYVSKTDISREEGSEYDYGRASMPEFQVMNLDSLRKSPQSGPRPVLWHAGCGRPGAEPPQNANPLCPFNLLMAYEEVDEEKVTPVVSDFDCFLVGTRGVEYHEPLGEQELSTLRWCVDQIEGVLDSSKDKGEGVGWTRQWLDVKKKYAFDPMFQVPMPKMGYADPRSSALMKGAVYSLRENGAVRHGPECFNYSFPQPLDDRFLVISDTLPGSVPWKYVDIKELREILAVKIDEGFTFPLNPKWILCDEGWKDLYDKLLASERPNVQDSLNIWYPEDVRERISAISSKHPNGFSSCEESSAEIGVTPAVVERRFWGVYWLGSPYRSPLRCIGLFFLNK